MNLTRYRTALFLLPTVATLLAVTIYPLLFALYASVHDWTFYSQTHVWPFVGLRQYQELLLDSDFRNSLLVTAMFCSGSVGLSFFIGLGLGLLFNRPLRGKNFFRTAVMLPLFVTPVVVGFGWRFMLQGRTGLITGYLLPLIGIQVDTVLARGSTALLSVIAADVWNQTPLMFLILLAGLSAIPRDMYEAAQVDGARTWQTFRYITIPNLRHVILIGLFIRTIDAFNASFGTIFIMTAGGPGTATETLPMLGWRIAFLSARFGTASALAMLMVLIMVIVGNLYVRSMR